MNPGVQAWSILSSEDVLRPHISFSLEASSSVGVKGCNAQDFVCICPWRASAWAFRLQNSTWMKSVNVFLISNWKATRTPSPWKRISRGTRSNIRRGVISRTSSSGGDLPHLTWLLFSARRASTSSFTLNGLPTSTVILWKGQTRAVRWARGSRPPPPAVCVLPSRCEACRASRWAERRSDLTVSTVRTLPPASGGSPREQRRACDRTPTPVLTHVPERQDDGMERALGY